MPAANSTRNGGHDAPRTIEEIERRAEEIEAAELDALSRIAALLRDLAVELPADSKLPVSFARTAKRIDRYVGCTFHPSWATRDLSQMVDDAGREQVATYVAQLEEWLDGGR